MDLTIIIPTRERSCSVIECILALEHNDADILVVDDASAEPVALPRRARVIRLSRPRGRSACINTGLKVARHDTVLILDDDIYAAPDMVTGGHDNPILFWPHKNFLHIESLNFPIKVVLSMQPGQQKDDSKYDAAAKHSG